jgi:hypothetical protein
MRERLYSLAALRMPPAGNGQVRAATMADFELCLQWFTEFVAEAGLHGRTSTGMIRRRIQSDLIWLWTDEDDRTVSTAATVHPAISRAARLQRPAAPDRGANSCG